MNNEFVRSNRNKIGEVLYISRKPRLWFPGATYHIMSRGNHRGDIFREEEDYLLFLHLLHDTQKIYPFLLHSYCLMTNHFHLQIETEVYTGFCAWPEPVLIWKRLWIYEKRISQMYYYVASKATSFEIKKLCYDIDFCESI